MTYEQVEAFIAIVATGNVTKASETLYVTQSTVSTRIQQLESELGVQLFLRQRGKRHVELTHHGKAFVPMAERWAVLWKDTLALRSREECQTLTVASVDVVNLFALAPLFNQQIAWHPELRLDIRTHHSEEIHALVERRVADVGFVYRNVSFPNVVTRTVYQEPMLLVCHRESDYHDGMMSADLDPSREVRLDWSVDWRLWHERNFGMDTLGLVTVDSGSTLPHYLVVPGSWAVAPTSVIDHALSINPNLEIHELADPPRPLVCYQVMNRDPIESHVELIGMLNAELDEYVRASPIVKPV